LITENHAVDPAIAHRSHPDHLPNVRTKLLQPKPLVTQAFRFGRLNLGEYVPPGQVDNRYPIDLFRQAL
jgi:hypothetical protein